MGMRSRLGRHSVAIITALRFRRCFSFHLDMDIAGGHNGVGQLLARPALRVDPYATSDPAIFLCSASTPPGGGVHGMGGYHAARSAERRLARG